MPARLVPLNPGPAPTIPVQRPVQLVGRHPDCDVRIDLPKISRRHCCVALAYDRIVIRDLGSSNGLRVNGHVVEETQLHHGDEVAIGPLLYRLDNPEAVAPRPSLIPAQNVAPKRTDDELPDLPSLPDPVNTSDDLYPLDP